SFNFSLRSTTKRPFRILLPADTLQSATPPEAGGKLKSTADKSAPSAKKSLTFTSPLRASETSSRRGAHGQSREVAADKRHDTSTSAAGSHKALSLSSGSKVAKTPSDIVNPEGLWARKQPVKRKQLNAGLDLPSPIPPASPKSLPVATKAANVLQSTPLPGSVLHKSRESAMRLPHLVALQEDAGKQTPPTFVSAESKESSQTTSSKGHSSHRRSHSGSIPKKGDSSAREGGSQIRQRNLSEEPVPTGGEGDQGSGATGTDENPPLPGSRVEVEPQEGDSMLDIVKNDSGLGLCLTVARDVFAEKM
ncbi:unnamed protein product, partial [Ixodes hexagonus]